MTERLPQRRQALGTDEQQDYNENDRVTRVVLGNGRVYSFTYTPNDNSGISTIAVRDSAGPSIRFDLIGPARYAAQWIE